MVRIEKGEQEEKTEKEQLIEKYVKKSLASDQPKAGMKYRICSKCGATIPHDTRKCTCGAEYSAVSLRGDYPKAAEIGGNSGKGDAAIDEKLVDEKFSALTESFSSAEGDLEQIAEEIAVAVKGDIKKREDKFQEAAVTIQDTIMRLQQEVSEIKDGFGKIAEDIAAEVRDEIRKHEEGKIQGIEVRIKDTLDQLHADMKREGLSLKEEDTKIRGAKKELYEEVNKLMDHLKKNEKELMEKENALAEKEAELGRRKADMEATLSQKDAELNKKKTDADLAISSAGEWKREEARLKAEIERLKSAVTTADISADDGGKNAEIAKIQSKILIAVLKEKPEVILKVIKSMNISKEELRKLVT